MHISYTIMFILYRSHVYDAVELHSQIKTSTTTDYDYALVSSNSKMAPSAIKSKQDIKADTIELQENPSYAATNEFS